LSEKFKAGFGLKNRHIQTLYSSFFRKAIPLKIEIEQFILDDDDFLEAFWHKTPNSHAKTPIAILFHGLEGSYKSPYIQGIMKELASEGFNSVLMHFRGCSGVQNNQPRAYHSGETGDAKAFIKSVHQRFPHAKLFGVGYSLGGNMLLKLLGEYGENSPFSCAVSVSAPMQLDVCADVVNSGFSLFYQWHLVKSLKKSLLSKYEKHDMQTIINKSQKEIKNIKTFWEFDEVYTAKIHGFKSSKDYYKKCSSKQFLKDIKTPTLIIHAKDDPFMNEKIIPNKDELSKYITLEILENGGHVGFIQGSIFKPNYWLEPKIVKFFNTIK